MSETAIALLRVLPIAFSLESTGCADPSRHEGLRGLVYIIMALSHFGLTGDHDEKTSRGMSKST